MTFKYTVENKEKWALTNTELVIVADSKEQAIEFLSASGVEDINPDEVILLETGVHFIQYEITE